MKISLLGSGLCLALAHAVAESKAFKNVRRFESHNQMRGNELHTSEIQYPDYGGSHGGMPMPSDPNDLNAILAHNLRADTEQYISQLAHLFQMFVAHGSPHINVDSHFSIESTGNYDLTQPCGTLHADHVSHVIDEFLSDPEHATLGHHVAEYAAWRPTDECLYRHNSLEIEGGMHGEVSISCDGSVLATASLATAGVSQKFYWTQADASAVSVGVSMLNGTIVISDTVGDLSPPSSFRTIPKDAHHILEQLGHRVMLCSYAKKINIHGVIGGGWRQLYTPYGANESEPQEYSVSYANAYDISFADPHAAWPSLPPMPPFGDNPHPEWPSSEEPPHPEWPTTDEPPIMDWPPMSDAPHTEWPMPDHPPTEWPTIPPNSTWHPAATTVPFDGEWNHGSGDATEEPDFPVFSPDGWPTQSMASTGSTIHSIRNKGVKTVSLATTAMYFNAMKMCANQAFDKGCFVDNSFKHLHQGEFGNMKMTVTNVRSHVFPFVWIAVVVAAVVVGVFRTKMRRRGYNSINTSSVV